MRGGTGRGDREGGERGRRQRKREGLSGGYGEIGVERSREERMKCDGRVREASLEQIGRWCTLGKLRKSGRVIVIE